MRLSDEEIKMAAHEMNRSLRMSLRQDPGPNWDELSSRDKQYATQEFDDIAYGRIETPEDSWREWAKVKYEKGYQFGIVRNDDPNKGPLTHPLLFDSYDEVPELEKLKESRIYFIQALLGRLPATLT